MISRILTKAAALVLLGSLAATPALAQMGPGMGGPGMMDGGGPGNWWGGSEGMASRVEGRLAFLKAELKITEAQKDAWHTLADAVRTSTERMVERMKSMHSGEQKALTLPDRLELHEQFMTARLDEIRQIKSALKSLYAVLSDDQKKEADTLVLPMMGMGTMGMGPGMMTK